jgi:putative PIN family toxin of toxin-antitoxin system
LRVALDTNVIVSALATRGLCADLFQAVLAEHDLIVGETVLVELRKVLSRKLRLPNATIDALDGFIRRQALVVSAEPQEATARVEAADATVLAEAQAAAADVLVTGDQDLLRVLHPPVRIVAPRQLWELIRRAP